MKDKKITKAIVLVAGLGTRNLPASKELPKEMLPVYDTPAIEMIIRSLAKAGIKEVMMVTGRHKRAIEDHFDKNEVLETALENKGKMEELAKIRELPKLVNLITVRQFKATGDGDAIKLTKSFAGEDPVVVLFGDCIISTNDNGEKRKNSVEQLIETYERVKAPVVLSSRIDKSEASSFGIIDYLDTKSGKKIEKFVEKPKVEEAPSNLAAPGQYIITKDIYDELDEISRGDHKNEVRLADALANYISKGNPVYTHELDGLWLDTGNHSNLLQASVYYGIRDKKDGAKTLEKLEKIISDFKKGKK